MMLCQRGGRGVNYLMLINGEGSFYVLLLQGIVSIGYFHNVFWMSYRAFLNYLSTLISWLKVRLSCAENLAYLIFRLENNVTGTLPYLVLELLCTRGIELCSSSSIISLTFYHIIIFTFSHFYLKKKVARNISVSAASPRYRKTRNMQGMGFRFPFDHIIIFLILIHQKGAGVVHH